MEEERKSFHHMIGPPAKKQISLRVPFPATAQHPLLALKQAGSPSPSIDCIGSQGQRDFESHRDFKLLPKNYCSKTSELRLFLPQPERGLAVP